jgi:hypothetical protein
VSLQKDLREFIESLNSHEVEFVVVGAHAVAFHGFPRFTGDIDLLVRPTRDNAERVMAALKAFGFASPGLSATDFIRPDSVVQLGVPPNRIDLLTAITGVGFDEAWAGRSAGALGGLSVNFLGYDSLLKNKQATGRGKDAEDVASLKAIRARERRPS